MGAKRPWFALCCFSLLLTHFPRQIHAVYSVEELSDLSAAEAVDLLCSRKITAVEYAKALLARAEEIDCLNSYAELDSHKVLEDAAAIDSKAAAGEDVRPLCGLAFAVKDNIDVAGYQTVAGLPAFEGFKQEKSAPLVERLQAAHGVVLGKTRMHELAFGTTSISPQYGAVLNPYQINTHVGGSSGGTGALVAARGVTAGFCSDTGGSCRIPASLTGTVGYRPTSSGTEKQTCYNAAGGIVPMSTTRDTVGLMARSVGDVKLLDTVLNSCSRKDRNITLKGLRLGYPVNWWQDIGQETTAAFAAALDALKAAGVELVEFDVSAILEEHDTASPQNKFGPYIIYEMPRELSRYIFTHGYDLSYGEAIRSIASPPVKQLLDDYSYKPLDAWPTPQDYAHMLGTVRSKMTEMWNGYFTDLGFDVLLVPTTSITARPIDAAEPYSDINGRADITLVLNTRTAAIDCPLGVPGLSLPIGLASNGLPIGLQLQSRVGDDGMLLSVGEALEAVLPKQPPPPRQPACHGCKARVQVREPTASLERQRHATAKDLSVYDFTLEGSCAFLDGSKPRDEL